MGSRMTILRERLSPVIAAGTCVVFCAMGCGPAPKAGLGRVWPPPPEPPSFKLVDILRGASDFGRPGVLDAIGAALAGHGDHVLFRPQGVAVREDKQLYVTDIKLRCVHVFNFGSHKSICIREVDKEPLVSPVGVASCGELVAISDSARKEVLLIKPDGRLAGKISKPGGFKRPTGLTFFAKEKLLYVVDTLACEVCVFDLSGRLVRKFGSRGTGSGQFNYPTYIAVDDQGKVYVTDSLNFRVQVFDGKGRFLMKIGKHGDATGHLGMPKGVAVDRLGLIYIVDSYFSCVQVFDQQGRFLLSLGESGDEPGSFQLPRGLAVGPKDKIYVSDSHNNRVQVVQYVGANNVQPPSGP